MTTTKPTPTRNPSTTKQQVETTTTFDRILRKADYDVDKHLNLIIPAPALHKLPSWFSRFLGHHEKQPHPIPDIVRTAWVLVASFAGVITVMATLKYGPAFVNRDCPIFIPSWVGSFFLLIYHREICLLT